MRIQLNEEKINRFFDQVKGDPSFEHSKKLFDSGHLPLEMVQAMLIRPDILNAFTAFSPCVYPGGRIERVLKEKVIIRASRLNACQFCTDSHCDFIRDLRITQGDESKPSTDRERVAIEYCEVVTRDANLVSDDLFSRLRRVFTDEEIVELTFVIGWINLLNRFNNALQIRYHGEYARLQAAV